MRCPQCGDENTVEMKFCGECGTRLAVLCRECGARNALTQKFAASVAFVSSLQFTVLCAELKGSIELLADRDPEEARKLLG